MKSLGCFKHILDLVVLGRDRITGIINETLSLEDMRNHGDDAVIPCQKFVNKLNSCYEEIERYKDAMNWFYDMDYLFRIKIFI